MALVNEFNERLLKMIGELAKDGAELNRRYIPIEWIEQNIRELDTELNSLYLRFRSQGDSKEKNEALLRCVEISKMLDSYKMVLSEWRKENEQSSESTPQDD